MKQAPLWIPMSAAHPKGADVNAAMDEVIDHLPKPLMGSTKLDGIRCTVQNGKLYSKSLKLLPNLELQEKWGFEAFNGLDAEITVGNPHAADVFNKTTSVVMSRSADASAAVLRVFDKHCDCDCTFEKRYAAAKKTVLKYNGLSVVLVEHVYLHSIADVKKLEKNRVEQGCEGIMLRDPYAKYKHGRSTVKEGGLVAIKRFVDAEAEILSTFEQQTNTNEKTTNELGRGKRSHAQEGMVANGTLGGFRVQLLTKTGNLQGVEFNIGTGIGLTNAYRTELWTRRAKLKGKVIKFKYQAVGSMEAPRLPIFLGFRDRRDM